MTWLITGGAGYIGAHVARAMADAGERVVALDDLSAGNPARLPADVPLVTAPHWTATC
jgi:UDP-glucose 4-epimerase